MTKNTSLFWLITLLLVAIVTPATAQFSITEDFSTTTNRDDAETTADWNTSEGKLKLFPYEITTVGSLNTSGACRGTFLDGHYLYVADGYSGLQVMDVSDATDPSLVGTVNTPGYAYRVEVSGNYAYVADHSGGMRVIDVTDPTNPAAVGNVATTNDALGLTISGNMVMVAQGEYLQIFDISNPIAPVLLATELDTGAVFRHIKISGNYAYVAGGEVGLVVFDITDPANPSLAGKYDTPGIAFRLDVAADVAYVLDQGNGIIVFDVSDPTDPLPMTTIPDAGVSRSLTVNGDKLYWALDGNGVRVVDISTPANPSILSIYDTPGHAYDVAVAGELAFVADFGSGLQVLKVADQMNLRLAGAAVTAGQSNGIFVAGNYAYIADGSSGLKVMDVSNRFDPVLVGTAPCNGSANAVSVTGNWAFLACAGTFGLQVYDVSTPDAPVARTGVSTVGDAKNLFIQGNYLYLAAGSDGLQVYDIESEMGAYLVSSRNPAGEATDVFVSGNYAYVSYGAVGMRVFDVSIPTNIVEVALYDSFGSAYSVYVEGDVAVLGTFDVMEVVDVSNPSLPVGLGAYGIGDAEINDLVLMGNSVFATFDYLGMVIFDISDPNSISPSGYFNANGVANGIFVDGDLVYLTSDITGSSATAGLEVIQAFQGEVKTSDFKGKSQFTDLGDNPLLRYRISHTGSGLSYFSLHDDLGFSNNHNANLDWNQSSLTGSSISWEAILEWHPGGSTVSDLHIEWLTDFAIIESISDVPDDQGGKVRLQWSRSGHDFIGDSEQIVEYAVYRHFDTLAASEVKVAGGVDYSDQSLLVHENANLMLDSGWDFVTSVPVLVQDNYAVVVPTLADSTIAGGQNFSTFKVVALTAMPGVFFSSPADSGYSVDNLEPSVPTSIVAAYQPDSVELDWDDAPEEDFQYFRIYRHTQDGFVPSPEYLVHQVAVSAWTDQVNAPWQYFYKITAMDYAGNESDPGLLNATSDAPGAGTANIFALQGAAPNPFNPSTTIKYSLAKAGMVHLVVYDLAGHKVRTLVNDAQSAGAHHVQWDGRNQAGAMVASGVYLYQLRSGNQVERKRMLLMK